MPYAQRSPRQLRRHVITYADVCRANQQVTREIDAVGFWNDRLAGVDVYWTTHSLVCYHCYHGDIHIPAVSGAPSLSPPRSSATCGTPEISGGRWKFFLQ